MRRDVNYFYSGAHILGRRAFAWWLETGISKSSQVSTPPNRALTAIEQIAGESRATWSFRVNKAVFLL
jgi:hypothetical protein